MSKTNTFLLFLPILLALLLYWPSLGYDFAWIDQYEILDRGLILASISDFWGALFFDDQNFPGYHRPLYTAMHSLDYAIWGTNPLGFHLSSVVFHLLNVGLLLLVLRRMKLNDLLILLIVTAWAIAPLNAASVALIHSKGDLLSTTFVLLSFLVYLRNDNRFSPLLFALCLLGGLWSKEVAIAGAVLVGVDIVSSWKERMKYGYALLCVLVIFVLQRFMLEGNTFEVTENYWSRLTTFPLVYGSYFFESMTGVRLSISDAVWSVSGRDIGEIALYILMAISAAVLQFFLWRRLPQSRPFILLFNLFLLPVSQLVPTLHYRADRFLYLASLGWYGMMGVGIFALVKNELWRKMVIAVVVVSFGLGLLTYLPIFKNDKSLFGYTLDQYPECREANAFYGLMMMEEKDYTSSMGHFSKAINNNPNLYSYVDKKSVKANIGTLYLRQGEYKRALEMYEDVIALNGYSPSLDLNMGIAYKMLGQTEKAYQHLTTFQNVYPEDLKGMEKMAEVYIDLGRKQKAIDEFNRILRLYPDHQNRQGINAAIEGLRNAR